jgi:hypothetical protein
MVSASKVSDIRNWCILSWMLLSRYPDVDRDENINAVLWILSLQRTHHEEARMVKLHTHMNVFVKWFFLISMSYVETKAYLMQGQRQS